MDRSELVGYWLETAERDYITVQHLFDSGDYHWSLFMAHLVVEKLLKAVHAARVGPRPPRDHNLVRLAEAAGLETDAARKEVLARLTLFHTNARYPDFKREFYRLATREYAAAQLAMVREIQEWLLKLLPR
jgi:HEPN domain-containing protein